MASRFDARPWSGVQVVTVAATPVTLPAYGTGEGVFGDAMEFLNGRGSRDDDFGGGGISGQTLALLAQNGWTGAATVFTAGIDDDDRVWLESSLEDFALDAAAGNAFLGFPAGGTGNVGGGAPFRHTASAEWTRGNITNIGLVVNPAGAGANYPIYVSRAQSVVTFVRNQNEGDADALNPPGNLERLIQEAIGGAYTLRLGIDDNGHAYMAWPTGLIATVTWDSASFRDRLGFAGDEAIGAIGATEVLTATHPLPGLHVAPAGLEFMNPGVIDDSVAARLTSGAYVSNRVAFVPQWQLGFRLTGSADATDLHRHWFDQVLRYVWPGAPVTLYQHWGDPRRALMSHQVTADQPGYDLLYTSERNGYQGRLDAYRSGDDQANSVVQWSSAPYRTRALITMNLSGAR
ncbi:MAG: hypothetical protein Q8Q14_00500 [Gemmatimonadales bacterium]|nr:hypothetical protein [Gemmatimonadales bacterium]